MLAVILAGGKGTRLKPFTMTIPKPLLPLGDVPVLEVVLRQLANDGFTRVVLTLGHMAPLFTAHFGDGSRYGVRIEYVREEEPLGTAGPLRLLADLPDDFLVMNGDLLTDLSYRDLVAVHRASGAAATIAVARREERIDYGVIEIAGDGAFLDYREKPVIPYYVSMGINVLTTRALRRVPPAGRFDMPDLMLALHRGGDGVHCHRTSCYWQDIGRFDDYTRASEDFVADPARFIHGPRVAGG
ncbi:MAG: NTP transferase domain-containing protein [Gemmatimonadetes bacterium]|nr:NTP transferase domain-containing protein [Gemmatimonadota bacterium]